MAAQNSIRLPGSLVRRFHFGGMVGRYQAGGTPTLGPTTPTTPTQPGGLVGGIQQSLAQYNPQFAAPIQNIAGQVSGFNPFAGDLGQTAQGTLSGLLSTGLPTDVSGLTNVAQARAGRQFEDFLGGAREKFGALNLGSSSALEAAKAREASRLSQGVAEQGIISGVGAAEAATGRRAGAFNPFLAANEQALQAKLGAGGLYGTAANVGFNPIQGGLGLSGQLIPPQAQQMNLPPAGGGGAGGAGGLTGAGGGIGQAGSLTGAFDVSSANPASTPSTPQALGGRFASGAGGNRGRFYARGGRVDYGDYLSNLLFGQEFTRRDDLPERAPGRTSYQLQPQQYRAPAPAPSGLERIQARLLQEQLDEAGRRQQAERMYGEWLTQRAPAGQQVFGGPRGDQYATSALRFLGPQQIGENLRTGAALQFPFAQAIQTAGGVAQQGIASEAQKSIAGVGRKARGGVIDGPSQPPDVVPILAQGGEVILPLKTVAKLRVYKGKDPLIKEIQRIAKRHPSEQAQGGGIPVPPQGGPLAPSRIAGGGDEIQVPPSLADIQGLSISAPAGEVPTYTLRGTPEEPGAQEERDLEDAIRNAQARYNRLYSLALRSPREAPIHELVGRAQQEVDEAKQDLLKSRQSFVQKTQAEAQKENAAANKAAVEAARAQQEAALKAEMDDRKTQSTAIRDIINSASRQGGSPIGALITYFQAIGQEIPPGLLQAAQAEQAAAQQQAPAPVTSGLAGVPTTVQDIERLKAQQEAENRFLSGVSPGRRALNIITKGAVPIPESAPQTPPLEVSDDLEQIEAMLQSFEQGGISPEQTQQYMEYLAYLAARNLASLTPAQRQRIVALNRQMQ